MSDDDEAFEAFMRAARNAQKAQAEVDRIIRQTEWADAHVVLTGNPVEGITVCGPFRTGMEAADWAALNVKGEWWVAPLEEPTNDGAVDGVS